VSVNSAIRPVRRASARAATVAVAAVVSATAVCATALVPVTADATPAGATPLTTAVKPAADGQDPAVLPAEAGAAAALAVPARRLSTSTQRANGQSTPTAIVPWKPIPVRGTGTPRPALRLPAAYDVQPTYEPQQTCQNVAKPGAIALRDILLRTYPGTGSYGIATSCIGRSHVSEHLEGRAFDWKVSISNPQQKAQAETFLFWLTAVDGAMAKRLGVMYVMWDGRIWGAYAPERGWRPFTCSGATACHRDHVHISLTWDGAYARTSFYSGRAVTVTDRGPCVVTGHYFAIPYNDRIRNPYRCGRWLALPATDPVLAVLRANARRNVSLRERSSAILALESVLGGEPASTRSSYLTGQELAAFQFRRGLRVTGTVTPDTWRELARYASGGTVTW